MAKIEHPWQIGPTELIEFALERMNKGSDFDRRLAFLILDVGVETLIKTVLSLPESVSGAKTSMTARNTAIQGGFYGLIQGLREALPAQVQSFDLAHVQFYHNIRNTLYHEGTTVATVRDDQLRGYAILAVDLLRELLKVDLSELLGSVNQVGSVHSLDGSNKGVQRSSSDPVADTVEVETSAGRYRIERLASQTIRVISVDTGQDVDPVKPFLRKIIEEKSLDVNLLSKSGGEKNTRMLGREIIKELKPGAWHGWTYGQRVRKDTLVSALTGRIRSGDADEAKWAVVDYIRSLKEEVLVFQPTGRAFGNSPFNLNCWVTENGAPIKRE